MWGIACVCGVYHMCVGYCMCMWGIACVCGVCHMYVGYCICMWGIACVCEIYHMYVGYFNIYRKLAMENNIQEIIIIFRKL